MTVDDLADRVERANPFSPLCDGALLLLVAILNLNDHRSAVAIIAGVWATWEFAVAFRRTRKEQAQ